MQRAWTIWYRLVRGEHGQDLLEYGMLGALIAVVAIAAITELGSTIQRVLWHHIVNNL